MVAHGEMTETAWATTAPLLSASGRRGGKCRVINSILWELCTEAHWRDLSEQYGPWQTDSTAAGTTEHEAVF
jgi:transposase